MKFKDLTVLFLGVLAAKSFSQTEFILRYTESEPLGGFLARYSLHLQATVPNRPVHLIVDKQGRNPQQLILQILNDTDDDVSIELNQTVKLPILDFHKPAMDSFSVLRESAKQIRTTRFFGAIVPQGFVRQLAVRTVRAPEAIQSFGGGSGIVAVIDTGVDYSHRALQNRTIRGIDLIDPLGNGAETRGLASDVAALINPTTTPLLMREFAHLSNGHAPAWERTARLNSAFGRIPIGLGHGTMVAGAITLVAPNAKVLPIRAFRQDGYGSLFNVIRGIYAAQDRGAKVVNLSLNTYVYSPELEKTVDQVSDQGVILVASTGNDSLTNPLSYPARFRKVTAVASVDYSARRSVFSNAGVDMTWVSAPGEALYLPFPGQRYAGGWGTSFSAPLVSGLALQMLSRKPDATYSDLQSLLSKSNYNLDPNLGQGTLNVFASMIGL